jgi:hypothetical protein
VRGADIERFRAFCGAINVKPIILDLQDRTGTTVLTDVMTSFRLTGGVMNALDDATATAFMLETAGFNVVRIKIETTPTHPYAEALDTGSPMPVGSYFEAHVPVTVPEDQVPLLHTTPGAHVSKNVFKRPAKGLVQVMLTLRGYTTLDQFNADLDCAIQHLKKHDLTICEKVEIEFCVFDTNTAHDKEWISQG